MAESILSNIAAELILKLGSSVLNEKGLWWGLKDELEELKATLSTIQAVLSDAEDKSMDEPVKIWLGMLSEAMYDADDLLDDFSTEALRRQVTGGSKTAKKVRVFFSSSNQFAFGLKMAHKVKAMRERLDKIAANRKFHLQTRSSVETVSVAKRRDQTHSSPPEVVIGREAEKEAIIQLLLSSDYEENVSVVPIVGIGGLGKTTLAQLVYNDGEVQKHFELKMWVCVSEDFDVKLLVKKVKNPAFEFKATNLNEKKQLQNLTLRWQEDDYSNKNCSRSDVANDEMGLEALHAHQNLKGLSMYSYRGVKPPSWLPSLTNLVSLEFGKCKSIQWLPPFDQLSYLKTFCVFDLANLEHIDFAANFENGGSSSFFPSLTHLILRDCPNLKGFARCKTDDVGMKLSSISTEVLPWFPCLSELEIGGCPNLLDITKFSSYNELRIKLARMFGLEGLLEDPLRSGWKLVYVDRENDVLLLGEDPWPEFVNNVCSIKILSPQEVEKWAL